MQRHPLWHLTAAKVREYLREPEAIFWVLVFPVLLALALGIAFRAKGPEVLPVGVQEGPEALDYVRALEQDPLLSVKLVAPDDARKELAAGKVALVVIPGTSPVYWFDADREESVLARRVVNDALQSAAGRTDPVIVNTLPVTERGSRYIDFLIPGLLGLNLMGTGMWGIGFSIVVARSRGLLKRLVASPMRRSDYLLGQMLGRMVFLLPEVILLVGFGVWIFDVPFRGSILVFTVVTVVGAMAFSGFGLLAACRARTIEAVSGLMNFIMLPMWLLSGVFFSPSRFPEPVQPLVQALPLTALNDALRAVMLDGAGMFDVASELGIVTAWGGLAFAVALWAFRWR
jgi:ABC-type multidrug transport system permease subunit